MGRGERAHSDLIVFLNSGINLIIEKGSRQEKKLCSHTNRSEFRCMYAPCMHQNVDLLIYFFKKSGESFSLIINF